MNLFAPLILILLIAFSSGCSPPEPVSMQTIASGSAAAEIQAATPPPATTPELGAREAVAARLQIDVEFVEVVSSRAFDFPDSSLGCPQPGMAYVQSITPGHRVLVTVNNEEYDVRVSGSRSLICDAKALRAPGTTRTY